MTTTTIPVLVLGESFVGKTTYTQHIHDGRNFDQTRVYEATIGADMVTVMYDVEAAGETVVLLFNDCAGANQQHIMLPIVARNALVVLLVYDVTDRASFDAIETKWAPHVEAHCVRKPIRVLLGNKIDLVHDGKKPRAVTEAEVKALGWDIGAVHQFELATLDQGEEALATLRKPLDIALTAFLDECRSGKRAMQDRDGGQRGVNPLLGAEGKDKGCC